MFFKRRKDNPFKQLKSLPYETLGTIKDNGIIYEVCGTEKTNLNFDGFGEIPTIAFRIRPENDGDKSYYVRASFCKSRSKNDEDRVIIKFDEMPSYLNLMVFEEFVIPKAKKKLIATFW